MNIILLTVLLTLLGAGLVVLLVWLGVASWKSMRFIKNSKYQFEFIDKRIDENNNNLWKRIEEGELEINRRIDEVYRNIDETSTEKDRSLHEELNAIYREFDNLRSNIDSRFDKIHNKLSEKEK